MSSLSDEHSGKVDTPGVTDHLMNFRKLIHQMMKSGMLVPALIAINFYLNIRIIRVNQHFRSVRAEAACFRLQHFRERFRFQALASGNPYWE